MNTSEIEVGMSVIPVTLSVQGSESSRKWIGRVGIVTEKVTPIGGVRVKFSWAGSVWNNFSEETFVYCPYDLKAVEKKPWEPDLEAMSYTELANALEDANITAKEAVARSNKIRAEIERKENLPPIRVRKAGEIWKRRSSGALWLVRNPTYLEREAVGGSCPIVRIWQPAGGTAALGVNDLLTYTTDEDFAEEFEYMGLLGDQNIFAFIKA